MLLVLSPYDLRQDSRFLFSLIPKIDKDLFRPFTTLLSASMCVQTNEIVDISPRVMR